MRRSLIFEKGKGKGTRTVPIWICGEAGYWDCLDHGYGMIDIKERKRFMGFDWKKGKRRTGNGGKPEMPQGETCRMAAFGHCLLFDTPEKRPVIIG